MKNMVNYLNEVMADNEYLYSACYNADESKMKRLLTAGIEGYDDPPIIGVTFSKDGIWKYNSNTGHFLTVYSAMSDESAFMLGDPFIRTLFSGESPYCTRTSGELHKAYDAGGIGFLW